MYDLNMIKRKSRITECQKRQWEWWFCILVRRGEHKGCWITCTSPSFSSSLLFFLYCGWWTLKKRWRDEEMDPWGFKAAPQSKGFHSMVMIKTPPFGSLPSFHAYIWKTHLSRPLLTKQFLKWPFFLVHDSQ